MPARADVATPEFNPGGGVSDTALEVLVTCATPGAVIRYTTNGTDPTESDEEVPANGLLRVGRVFTLKARAWFNGEASAVQSQLYFVAGGVAAGSLHGLAVSFDGKKVWSWGTNNWGELGDGSLTQSQSPVRVKADSQNFFTDVRALAACYRTSIAVKMDGTVWAWGKNEYRLLGNSTQDYYVYPQQIMRADGSPLTGIKEPVALWTHALALAEGTLWGWGKNSQGHLGNGLVESVRSQATQVKFSDGTVFDQVVAVTVGKDHSLAIRADNTLWAWGYNAYGQLGDGTTTRQLNPKLIMTDVAYVGAGYNSSFAVKTDGTLWAWGFNANGELGIGSVSSPQLTPLQIFQSPGVPLTGAVAIECGEEHVIVLKDDGTVWAWGKNNHGQIAQGITGVHALTPAPVRVSGGSTPVYLSGVVSIASGDDYCIALKEDGSVVTWGYDGFGALGNGPSTSDVLFAVPNSYMPKLADSEPTVTLSISPSGPYLEPAAMTLVASGADVDGAESLRAVKFYDGEELLGTVLSAPYELALADVMAGTYSFTAVIADEWGATGTSAPQNVNVTDFYDGVPADIQIHSGDGQRAFYDQFLAESLVVKVSRGGIALENAPVEFSIVEGDGELALDSSSQPSASPIRLTTDASGLASVALKKGSLALSTKVRARLAAVTVQGSVTLNAYIDTDGDGMPDSFEVQFPGVLDLNLADDGLDLDGDGLSNLQEWQAGTDVNNADTDGDGMNDGWEVQFGFNPQVWNDPENDSDNDGVSDGDESVTGRNPNAVGLITDSDRAVTQLLIFSVR